MEREVKFGARTRLARRIDRDQWQGKKRAAPGAFLSNERDSHLSVDSLQIKSIEEIVEKHRIYQNGKGPVLMSIQTIYQYNKASKNTRGEVINNHDENRFEFCEEGCMVPAYKHRPRDKTKVRIDDSHCGVEYVRVLDQINSLKVARRLAKKEIVVFRSK